MDLLSSISDLQPPQISGSDEIKSHKLFMLHADRFSQTQTVRLGGQTLDMKGTINGALWKNLLPFSAKEGVIYSDDSIEV